MKKSQATQLFITAYYYDSNNLSHELKRDRLAVQYAWSIFIDSLCKNGEITQEQYNDWTFPWRYDL